MSPDPCRARLQSKARLEWYGRAALKRSLRTIGRTKLRSLTSREIAYCFLCEAAWLSELAHAGVFDLPTVEEALHAAYADVLPDEIADFDRRMQWAHDHGRAHSRGLDERRRKLPRPPEHILAAPPPPLSLHTFPLRRVFELERLTPSTDIVRGLIGPREKILLWGMKSAAKTTLAIDLGGSIVTGRDFFEHKVQHPGVVVYVAAEGSTGGIRNRAEAWCVGREPRFREALSRNFLVIPATPNLLRQDDQEALVHTLETAGTGAKVALVCIDTLGAVTPGADENTQGMGTAFVAFCNAITDRTGAAVLVVHHARKGGDEYRGSSAFGGGFDVILSSVETRAGFTLRVRKQKDRETPPDGWAFKAERVTLDEANDVRSVRVGGIARADAHIDRDVGLKTTLGRVADALVASGHPGADSTRRSLEAGVVILLAVGPKRFGEIVGECDCLRGERSLKAYKSSIGRALNKMKKAGHLDDSGEERNRTYSIADAGRKAYSGVLDALKKLPQEVDGSW